MHSRTRQTAKFLSERVRSKQSHMLHRREERLRFVEVVLLNVEMRTRMWDRGNFKITVQQAILHVWQ